MLKIGNYNFLVHSRFDCGERSSH